MNCFRDLHRLISNLQRRLVASLVINSLTIEIVETFSDLNVTSPFLQ